jgi:LmbE family N-acetylglucosaminyl deacetylase
MKKRIDELQIGDLVDLEGDSFADPDRDPAKGFEFQYAKVEEIDRETPDCVVVWFDNDVVGFPPDHMVEIG